MSQVLTHASLVIKSLEYVEETTFGVTPTNPTMNFVANTAKWMPKYKMDNQAYRRLGSEDVYSIIQGKKIVSSQITFSPTNSTFLKYGISPQGGGTGTIDKSLSIGFSFTLNGVVNYVLLPGSRINQTKISGNPNKAAIDVTIDLVHADMATPSITDYIGTGAHATADTNTPWNFASGGALPVTWGGTGQAVEDINVTIVRNIAQKYILGQLTPAYQRNTIREVKADFTRYHYDTTLEADMKAATPRTLAWVLASAVSTLTLSGGVLSDLSGRDLDASSKNPIIEKYGVTALSATIT
jgi:hypothetical protein